mmetsp:Transcript_24030/g.56683  ORF Transcript_24030/g.56683 Transcript_24030/m.56683 type:complete len:307 (+) Transcript_24030:642-1562(+)
MRRLTNSVYIRFPQTQKYQDEKTAVQPQCIRGHSSLDLVRDNEPGILVFYNKGRGSDYQCANNEHDRNSYSCNIFHDNSRRKPRIRSMAVALQASSHSARSAADSSINCFRLHSFLLFLSVFHGPGDPADYTEARQHQRCQYQSNCCPGLIGTDQISHQRSRGCRVQELAPIRLDAQRWQRNIEEQPGVHPGGRQKRRPDQSRLQEATRTGRKGHQRRVRCHSKRRRVSLLWQWFEWSFLGNTIPIDGAVADVPRCRTGEGVSPLFGSGLLDQSLEKRLVFAVRRFQVRASSSQVRDFVSIGLGHQ